MGHLKLAPPFNVVVSPRAQGRARAGALAQGGAPQSSSPQSSPRDPRVTRERDPSERAAEDARLVELAQRFAPGAQIMEDAPPSARAALNSPFGAFKALPSALQTLILALVLIALLPSLTLTAFIWLGPLEGPALALAEGPELAGKTSPANVKTASLVDLPLGASGPTPAAAPLPDAGQARLASPPALEARAGQEVPFAIALASVEPLPPRSVIAVSGLPSGAVLSAGRPYTDSEWNLRPEELGGLRLILPETAQGETVLNIAVIATDGETLAETKTALTMIAALPANAPGETAQAELGLAPSYDPFTVPAIGDVAAPETLAPEAQATETQAPEERAAETLTPETEPAVPETAVMEDAREAESDASAPAVTQPAPASEPASETGAGPATGPFANNAAKPEPSLALSDFVNLRARPTSSAPVIAVMAKGTQVTPTAKTRGWLKVTDAASGKTGWIYGRYAGGTATASSATASPSRLGPSSEESWLTRFGRWVVY